MMHEKKPCPKKLNSKIGEIIKKERISKKMSIEKLALSTDTSYSQIARIEKGAINTSVYLLYKLVNHLDIVIDFREISID